MTWLLLRLGRSLDRILLWLIALYLMATSPAARGVLCDYLRRALGRTAMLCDVFRHMFTFATVIHNCIYLTSGRSGLLDIQLQGQQHVYNALAQGRDAFLLGVYLGSFEVVCAPGQTVSDLRVAVVMYEENACNINAVMATINPAAASEAIPLGRMDAILQVREALDDNWLVDMLVDRTLLRDAEPSVQHMDFLDSPAAFPLGPLYMTAIPRRPALFMVGLHLDGSRYAVHSDLLADFTDVRRGDRTAVVQAAFGRYVERAEYYCRTAPYNWLSYFDSWQGADAAGAPGYVPADHQATQTP